MLSMQRTFVATLTRLLLSALLTAGRHAVSLQGWIRRLLLSALLTAGRHAVSLQGWIRRLQDPQPEDFAARGLRSAEPGTSPLGYFPILALTSALGVLLVSFAYDMSRYGNLVLEFLFF